MKRLNRLLPVVCALALVAVGRAQTASCTIAIPVFAAGAYDAYGANDTRAQGASAGFGAIAHVHGPYRSYGAFHIPPFAGTVTNATLTGIAYTISPHGTETLQFFSVTSSVPAVLESGLNKTNVYRDLGSGTVYGSGVFILGYRYGSVVQLNSSALADIQAARGSDFVMGGALLNPSSPPQYNEFVDFPEIYPERGVLELKLSVPATPTIYAQPPGPQDTATISNSFPPVISVGACGASPLTYRWFVNGTNSFSIDDYPYFYVPDLSTNPQAVFVIVSNAYGRATSSVTQVTLAPARFQPAFTNLTVRVGDYVALQPGVYSFDSFTMEWKKDGVTFSTYQNYELPLGNLQTNDSGDYTVTVSNSFGIITSPVMKLRVVETPPVFIEEAYDMSVPLGSVVYLGSTAAAGPPPSYQWYFNGARFVPSHASTNPVVLGTDASLEVPEISNSQTGRYYVVASNIFGVATSDVVTVTTYLDPPAFAQSPSSTSTYPGSTVTLSVGSVSGQPYPRIQWYRDGIAIPDTYAPYYTIYDASSNSAGAYFCVASNASGAITSQTATLTVFYVAPVVYGPFGDQTNAAGSSVSFYVSVGNPPVFLQLQFYGTNVPVTYFQNTFGVVALSLYNVDTSQSGPYRVVSSNAYGMSTSAVVTLTVTTAPPAFIFSPFGQTVLEGAPVVLTYTVSGAPTPRTSLYRDGIQVAATDNGYAFTLTNTKLSDSGGYYIVASNRYGMATSAVALVSFQRAGPLDQWTVRNPLPQGRDLNGVVWAQNQFVAVGDSGAIVTSPDGTNWMVRNAHTMQPLAGIAYGNGRFVAVSPNGFGITSTNGETWNSSGINTNAALFAITFGKGNFLAVGNDSISYAPLALRSSNGVDWSAVTIPQAALYGGFFAAAFGNGTFCALPYYGRGPEASADLLTWTNNDLLVVAFATRAAYLNNHFIALGDNGTVNSSPDGISWPAAITNVVNGKTPRLLGAAYGAGRYIVVATKGRIITSTGDFHNWAPVPSPTVDRLDDVVYGNNLFVAVGENGTILTSGDGLSWSNQTRGVNVDLDGLGVGNGLAVAVGKNGAILTSTDGTSWSYTRSPDGAELHGVAYGNGQWVAVGEGTNIITSTDGVTWTGQWPGFFVAGLKSAVYAHGLWVAVGISGQILTSPDAITWTARVSPVSFDLNEVTYGNGLFVIAGDHGTYPNATVLTSPDGVTWSDYTYYSGKNARGIAFANGTFVMPNNDGLILYGTNPVPSSANASNAWSIVYTPHAFQDGWNLRGATWSNGLWVVVGNNGVILTATNPASWRPRLSPTDENLHAVRYLNNTFIAIGNQGVILQSGLLVPQLVAELASPNFRVIFRSPYEGVFKVQRTENFASWQDLALITNVVGSAEYQVPLPSGGGRNFFRVVPP